MRILKYTFDIPQLIVEDGELIENGSIQETYTFTLLFKGLDLYEKISGKTLMQELTKNTNVKDFDISFVKELAKASYAKIEGNKFFQNMVTADEFSKTQAFARIGTDLDFMTNLIEMVMDCCMSENQKQSMREHASKK